MDALYWLARWSEGRTGWHQERPTPLMLEHWPALDMPRSSRVFVPLAGKSQDMRWLADQGYRVLGVELSPVAIEQFFAESGAEPRITSTRYGQLYEVGDIAIICGDVFALDEEVLCACDAVFDRAALIALPPPLRSRYVHEIYGRLPAGCRGLLITIDYPQHEKAGPPFSVPEDEVRTLFTADWSVHRLMRREILAQEGSNNEAVTAPHTTVYRLTRR